MTTDFKRLLSCFDKRYDLNLLIDLKDVVESKKSSAVFKVEEFKEGWIVSYSLWDDKLFIANEKACFVFLKVMEEMFGDVEFEDALERNKD